MVISNEFRYVFVELPRTGSSAIARELCANYGGRKILHKHATYEEFLKSANDGQKDYFVFSGIRNPLDDTVSLYFKLLTDHKSKFSRLPHSDLFTRLAYHFRWRQFRFVKEQSADFSRFFLRFFRWPYDNWTSLSHLNADYIVRFETLAEDFARVLSLLGIPQRRPLPVRNKTAHKGLRYWEYYDEEAITRARFVFGIYMQKWNYEFPPEWNFDRADPTAYNRFLHKFLNIFRGLYWRFLRPSVYARVSAKEHAQNLRDSPVSRVGRESRGKTR